MKYKLNPYKLLSLAATIIFVSYIFSLIHQFKIEKDKTTNDIIKTIKIRDSKFYIKEKDGKIEKPITNEVNKKNSGSVEGVVKKSPDQIAEEEKQKQLEKQQKELAKDKEESLKNQKITRQYIQVMTVNNYKEAQEVVSKLGSGFKVELINTKNGTKLYRIYSNSFDDKVTQQSYENKIKKILGNGQKYIIRKGK